MSSTYALQEPDFRMVLVGRTGAGKSASGNTILGWKPFKSTSSPSSVTSECQKEEAEFEGKRLAVVDTPGLFDTKQTEEEVIKEMVKVISFSAPGPHVFLVVMQASRFTKEEQEAVKLIQKVFGEQAGRYTMVLFTYGDNLEADGESIEEFLKENKDLRDFINLCGGRYHVFNNRNQDGSQVKELLKKINIMVQSNRGSFYTNEMLEGAERAIKEEMEQLQREDADMRAEEARRQAERKNKFIEAVLTALGGVGVAVAGKTLKKAGERATGVVRDSAENAGEVLQGVGVEFAVQGITAAVKEKGCVIQ